MSTFSCLSCWRCTSTYTTWLKQLIHTLSTGERPVLIALLKYILLYYCCSSCHQALVIHLVMLATSSGKCNVTVWHPSVCLFSNLNRACSAYSVWLTRGQHATQPHVSQCTFRPDGKVDQRTCFILKYTCCLWNVMCSGVLMMYLCRCRKSVEFSIRTAWLIGAYAADVNKPRWKTSQGVKLRKMILHEELRSVTFFWHSSCASFSCLVIVVAMNSAWTVMWLSNDLAVAFLQRFATDIIIMAELDYPRDVWLLLMISGLETKWAYSRGSK